MKRYIRQSVMKAPNGMRVRSLRRGAHVLRVAFPKGAKKGATGNLVSIIHPHRENPNLCKMRKNPGLELVVLGANPSKKRNKMPGHRNPVGAASGKSVDLYREFHGSDPTEIISIQESAIERNELVALGDLISISGKLVNGSHFEVQSDDIKLAANPSGSQLYLVGGSQANVMRVLVQSGLDTSKDLIEMGEAWHVVYQTRKEMHGFEVINYDHKFGEDGGTPPVLFFDKLKRKMFLLGGTYHVKPEGIVN